MRNGREPSKGDCAGPHSAYDGSQELVFGSQRYQIGQPGMQSVAPTRRLSRRSRDLLIAAAVVFLVGALVSIAGIALHIFNLVVPFNPGSQTYDLTRKAILSIGIGIIFSSFLMALRAITWKTDNALARELGSLLDANLDRQFVYIRNISKRPVGYLDAVLVSKHGVLVFRITKRRGLFFNDKGDWLRRRPKGDWKPMRWNPTREVVIQVAKLREYLEDFRLAAIPVRAVIVFTRESPLVQLTVREPAVPVIQSNQLLEHLRDSYLADDHLDAETVQRVVNLLYH